jgi:hypothetical protein
MIQASINNNWPIECALCFCKEFSYLTASFLDLFRKPYWWCHEYGLIFILFYETTKIRYVLTSQRRMLNYKMPLQLNWNHRIITKFFGTHTILRNRLVGSPHQVKLKCNLLLLYWQHSNFGFFFTGSLLSISVPSLLVEWSFTINLSMM